MSFQLSGGSFSRGFHVTSHWRPKSSPSFPRPPSHAGQTQLLAKVKFNFLPILKCSLHNCTNKRFLRCKKIQSLNWPIVARRSCSNAPWTHSNYDKIITMWKSYEKSINQVNFQNARIMLINTCYLCTSEFVICDLCLCLWSVCVFVTRCLIPVWTVEWEMICPHRTPRQAPPTRYKI